MCRAVEGQGDEKVCLVVLPSDLRDEGVRGSVQEEKKKRHRSFPSEDPPAPKALSRPLSMQPHTFAAVSLQKKKASKPAQFPTLMFIGVYSTLLHKRESGTLASRLDLGKQFAELLLIKTHEVAATSNVLLSDEDVGNCALLG